MAGIVERIERANGAGQWRAATDDQMRTDAESARPLYQPGSASLEGPPDRLSDLRGRRKLIPEEMLGGDRNDLAIKLRHRPNPGSAWKLFRGALHELRVRQAHVRGEMNDLTAFHHDQHGVPVAHLDFVAHGVQAAEPLIDRRF